MIRMGIDRGGIGAVLRDSTGKVIFSACGFVARCSSALEVELLACNEGIIMALQWTFLPVIVETDCLEVVQLIQTKGIVLSEIMFLVKEVRDLCHGSREVALKKIHRNQNRVSHTLANRDRCEACTAFWPDETCNFISHLLGESSLAE